jgi:methyl-accepting chemotaxis protein
MRSLSVKLTLIYIVSILLITGGLFFYLEKLNQEKDQWAAKRDVESGICSLNGTFPNAADLQALTNNPDNRVTGADINNRMAGFTHLIGMPYINGSISYQARIDSSVNSPSNPLSQDYFAILFFNINDHGIKRPDISLTIPRNSFSATIGSFNHFGVRSNNLYYKQVPGHYNLIYLFSMNDYTFPVASLKPRVEYDIQKAFPFALLFAIVFGFLISWLTVSPLKRITRAAEGFSRSDLSQRVKYKSNDEIGRLAVSFNTMADRLEDSFNSQKRFVSDAAHELRTPLASMKTSVTRAQIDERNTADNQKLLDFLSGRISHM